ncbi:MAG TPA: extracellular solute-binding protein [Chitinophagaceae bacterium]|nr:extracellular solute-binding protein [Chitinophagaceae bacterium]
MSNRIHLSAIIFAFIFFASCSGGGDAKNEPGANDVSKFKGATLNILCWEGYADPAFTKGFEDKYGVTVKGTYFGSSDELNSKLANGGGAAYDIISPSSDLAGEFVLRNLVAPIDTKAISQWDSLSPQLRNMNDVMKDGKVYGMPFTWGPDYLIYDADVVKTEPTSWKIFEDPQYKGKVALWDDISNLYLMGQVQGIDKTDPSALYNMTDAQLQSAKNELIKLKPQIRKYWATAGELDNMFKNKEVVLAVGWPLTPANLNREGRNLKAVIPQEGATGWIDRLMITAESKNKELAMLYLDYISQPDNMAKVLGVNNYNVANPGSQRFLTPELQKIADASQFFDKLNFWQRVKE